jgi:hypothetical protein
MLRIKIYISALLIFFVQQTTAKSVFPKNCEPIPMGEELFITTKKSIIVLVYNKNEQTNIWLTSPAKMGWSSQIQADRWSALFLNKKKFTLNCIESKPGHEQHISCSEAIRACKWKPIKAPQKLSKVFWAGESLSFEELQENLIDQGFKIPIKEHKEV